MTKEQSKTDFLCAKGQTGVQTSMYVLRKSEGVVRASRGQSGADFWVKDCVIRTPPRTGGAVPQAGTHSPGKYASTFDCLLVYGLSLNINS